MKLVGDLALGRAMRLSMSAAMACAVLPMMAAFGQQTVSAAEGPLQVSANYGIAFAGLGIGDFNFALKRDGRSYEITSTSGVKVLFGAFKWRSSSKTTGVMADRAMPRTFEFDYTIRKKRKRSAMELVGGNVVKLDNQPPLRFGDKHVPLEPAHLKGVVDPMTAILHMTQTDRGSDFCRKSIEIFDGRTRLRLTLSPNGRRRIDERKPSGQPKFGYVCRVRFTPIGGFKKGSDVKYVANNNGIEVVLRPIPSLGIAVPYLVSVPTMLGTVAITARRINILGAANQRIALVH